MNFDLSKMKKVSHDGKTATFKHPDGHTIKVAMGPLSEKMRKKLHELPMMAEGGAVEKNPPPPPPPPVDPEKAKKFSQGFNKALGFAEGGEAPAREPATKAPEDFVPGKDYSEAAKTGDAAGAPAPVAPVTINVGGADPGQPEPNSTGVASGQPEYHAAGATPAPEPAPGAVAQDQQPQAPEPQPTPAPVAQAPETPAVVERKPAISKPQQTYDDFKAEQTGENQKLQSDLDNGHITPQTYSSLFAKKDTLGKISTIFGLLLSGVGSGLTHQPNALLGMMDKEIDRDLEAQKKNQENGFNLLSLSKKQLVDNANVAHINTETQAGKQKIADIAQNDAKQKALQFAFHQQQQNVAKMPEGPQKQKAQALLGTVYNTVKEHINSLEDINAGIAAQGQGGGDGDDPSTLVATKVPQHLQAKVFDEIKAAQNTKKNGQLALDAFDRAVNDTQLFKTAGIRTPGSVSALHEALGPTFQDIEGTVRQAAMDNTFKNITPNEYDDATRTAEKRKALIGYLTGKTAAPIAKGFGIDLGKYGSTNWQPSEPAKEKASDGGSNAEAIAWANANPKDPRSKTILELAKGR